MDYREFPDGDSDHRDVRSKSGTDNWHTKCSFNYSAFNYNVDFSFSICFLPNETHNTEEEEITVRIGKVKTIPPVSFEGFTNRYPFLRSSKEH